MIAALSAAWSAVSGAAAGLWGKLALLLAIVAAVALVLLRARQGGAVAERAAQQARTLRIKEMQQDAVARAPRDRGGVIDRLHDGTF